MEKIRTLPLKGVSLIVVFLCSCVLPISQDNTSDASEGFPILTGPYLGQSPPGTTPEIFAPGVISHQDHFEHSAAVFSPDMSEVYWSSKPRGERYFKMYFMKLQNEVWTAPRIVPFLEINYGEKGPEISPDGNKLYFYLNCDTWVVERQGDSWSEPVKAPRVSDTTMCERIFSVTEDGSIYFGEYDINARTNRIYVSENAGVDYSGPKKLDEDFISGYGRVGSIFVVPDESYMLLELRPDNYTSEIFVSYRTKNNSWSDVIKLPIGYGMFPSVSPDGKYIFFVKRGGIEGIFWVSAEIVQDLRPTKSN